MYERPYQKTGPNNGERRFRGKKREPGRKDELGETAIANDISEEGEGPGTTLPGSGRLAGMGLIATQMQIPQARAANI